MNRNIDQISPAMKIAVCQLGARHRYAIPRMLEEAGCLAAFYCDVNADHPLIRLFRSFFPGIDGRRCEGVPSGKIHSTMLPNLMLEWRKRFRPMLDSEDFIVQGELFSRWIDRHWTDEADVLFTFSRINTDLARKLKGRGVRNVVDVIISPLTERILSREYCENSAWGPAENPFPPERVAREENLWRESIAVADLLLCPSQWVADGVLALAPEAVSKIRLVPYGCSIAYGVRRNVPTQGKIIFCGNDPLRKGLPYLARAATILKKRNPSIRIQVAGDWPLVFREDSRCADLEFLGKLSGAEMIQAYLSADVFLLPSLSEGFAGVVAEAICAGLPCVVTRESGSGVVDGRDGLVIPSRSASAIADAVETIVEDRQLRGRMAEACLAQRNFYSASAWRTRLMQALETLGK